MQTPRLRKSAVPTRLQAPLHKRARRRACLTCRVLDNSMLHNSEWAIYSSGSPGKQSLWDHITLQLTFTLKIAVTIIFQFPWSTLVSRLKENRSTYKFCFMRKKIKLLKKEKGMFSSCSLLRGVLFSSALFSIFFKMMDRIWAQVELAQNSICPSITSPVWDEQSSCFSIQLAV